MWKNIVCIMHVPSLPTESAKEVSLEKQCAFVLKCSSRSLPPRQFKLPFNYKSVQFANVRPVQCFDLNKQITRH